jgi:hypothetical protein
MRIVFVCGAAVAALLSGPAGAAVVISTAPTSNMNCSGGVCTATAANAVLNVSDLQAMLAGGNASVVSGSVASDIDVETALGWASANRLTLDAFHGIAFDAPVSVTGGGGLTLTTNDGGANGDFAFGSGGFADFWDLSSSLTINGTAYTLENDLGTLAGAIAASPSGAFALARNYDASVNGIYHHSVVMTRLTGTFEGLGHTVSNLSVRAGKKYGALFDSTDTTATLRDLTLAAVSIKGGDAAALDGFNQGAIIQCASSGSVTAVGRVGGLVAYSFGGYILRSHSSAAVHGGAAGSEAGGLVGDIDLNNNQGHTPIQGVFNSYATGDVTGEDAGGLAGHLIDDLDFSYATGTVRGAVYAGGLVGADFGSIKHSFASGAVSGPDGAAAGGAIGYLFGAAEQTFATGAVKGGNNSMIGGFMGTGYGTIDNSYATGSVQAGTGSAVGGFAGSSQQPDSVVISGAYSTGFVHGQDSGGFQGDAGFNSGAAYWDIDTSGKGAKSGIAGCKRRKCRKGVKGLTTSEFQSGLPAGFDPSVWTQSLSINNGYPYLIANPPQ